MSKVRRMTQIALPLVLAFLVGTQLTHTTRQVMHELTKPQTFTVGEAQALVGKQVRDKCFSNFVRGTVVSFDKGSVTSFNQSSESIFVGIKWEHTPLGQNKKSYEHKLAFDKCTEVVQPE